MSLNDTSVTAALAFILSTYSESPAPIETTVVRNAPKASKSAKTGTPIAPSGEANTQGFEASKNKEPGPKSEPLPAKGTIGASEFLKGLPSCGKRPNDKGVMVFQGPTVQRDDEMRLVASFVGWSRDLHGTQLENARRAAQIALKPVTALTKSHRGASASLAGFVAGLPDNQQKLVQDLLAREQVAAKAIVTHTGTINTTLPSNPAHVLAIGLLAVEEERLTQIRKDLSALGAIVQG